MKGCLQNCYGCIRSINFAASAAASVTLLNYNINNNYDKQHTKDINHKKKLNYQPQQLPSQQPTKKKQQPEPPIPHSFRSARGVSACGSSLSPRAPLLYHASDCITPPERMSATWRHRRLSSLRYLLTALLHEGLSECCAVSSPGLKFLSEVSNLFAWRGGRTM